MNLGKAIRADFGSGLHVRSEYGTREKLVGHLSLARPVFLVLTPLNAASAAVLSIGGLPSWQACLAGFFTGAFAAAGVNVFNQWADRRRDAALWPQRAIPSGRVRPGAALGIALVSYALALSLCWQFFNPTAFFILLAAIVFGSLYSTHLRDKVGYLSLPPIEGLIFLCGWACLAPASVMTLLPWYLYLLGLVWQSSHIVAHYMLAIRYDDARRPVIATPALLSKPSPRTAAGMIFGLAALLLVMSGLLPLLTHLSVIYIIPVAAWGLYTVWRCWSIVEKPDDNNRVHRAWSALSLMRLIISLALIIDVLVAL